MRRFGFGAVVVGVLAAAAAGGQEAVTLKAARPKPGERVRVTKTEKTTSTVTFGAGGQTQTKDEATTRTIVYLDEVVTPAEGAGRPLKLKRTYEKYEVTKGGKDEPGPPLNTVITIEKKGDKYEFTADGKPVDAAFASKLSSEFDKGTGSPREEDLLPKNPVKPGDTWKIDPTKLAAAVGGQGGLAIDADRSSLTGKLVKTYQKDGKLFGVTEYTGDLVIKDLGPKAPLKVKPGGKFSVKMTEDGCIDGTEPSRKQGGTISIKMDAEGMGITLNISADGTLSETVEPVKK